MQAFKNIQVYNSLDNLRFILFWQILKERNPKLLDKSYTPEKKYSKEEEEYIMKTWYKLYDEYHKIDNDQRSKNILNRAFFEIKLQHKINTLISNANFLINLQEYKEFLSEKDFIEKEQMLYSLFKQIETRIKIKYFESFQINYKIIQGVINSLETELKLKQNKQEQKIDEEIKSVYSLVVRVEDILGRSIPNINDISVTQWIEYKNLAKEKQNQKINGIKQK